ncbi:YbjQ family protein [Candidatus Uabimicrobium sp. HlEnr_7]|uniref:YbjQ family protein n=1 Tax=Candidatus Uabimicrobium helgolandensis TaxID=3095367 RepID=UPI003557B0A3
MMIVTTDRIIGKEVRKTLGVAKGNTIRTRHMGRDIMALFKNIVGGEVQEYTQLLAQAREQALERMKTDAQSLGANAVIQVRFTTSVLMGGAAEMLAYGTAVVVE